MHHELHFCFQNNYGLMVDLETGVQQAAAIKLAMSSPVRWATDDDRSWMISMKDRDAAPPRRRKNGETKMKWTIKFILAACAVTLSMGVAGKPSCPGKTQQGATIDLPERPAVVSYVVWSVMAEPVVAVKGTDEQIHVAYELLFTNGTGQSRRIKAVEAVDPHANDAVVGENQVVAIAGTDVTGQARLFSQPLTFTASNYSSVLPPGESGIVYMDLTFAHEWDVPSIIGNQVTVSPEADPSVESTTVGALTQIHRRVVTISPPLRSDRWVDGDGCCKSIGPHRFTALPINGTERVSEHFAIDFVKLGEDGREFSGNDPTDLTSYYDYGADVLAVAAGKVIAVVDGLPDQVPGPGNLPAGITLETAGGNYVVIHMRNGLYAFYAHMIPGSIVVEDGDVVRTGQLLGRLGNSGNSDGPHLHFHVMTDPSPLETVGVPFLFDRMELQGQLVGSQAEIEDTLQSGGAPAIDFSNAGHRLRQMPLTSDLLRFE